MYPVFFLDLDHDLDDAAELVEKPERVVLSKDLHRADQTFHLALLILSVSPERKDDSFFLHNEHLLARDVRNVD